MVCPNCRAGCATEDIFCRRCGTDLSVPSHSLVPAQKHLPAKLSQAPLPSVAVGVGAVVFGFGLELLRRSLLARLARPARRSARLLPALSTDYLPGLLESRTQKPAKLPRGYEVQEVVICISRVIRRRS